MRLRDMSWKELEPLMMNEDHGRTVVEFSCAVEGLLRFVACELCVDELRRG